MKHKRISIFAGHYGSGKTTLALEYALYLRSLHPHVAVADLDIVNPYFRTTDSRQRLAEADIRLIVSEYANTNAEFPSFPPEVQAIFDDESLWGILDIGGDDRGALALGRYAPRLADKKDWEMLMVINQYRPLSGDAASIAEFRLEIEKACGLPFSALVNNSHLGAETTAKDILDSLSFAQEASRLTKLPVKFTAVKAELYPELAGIIPDLLPLNLPDEEDWQRLL